jgi:hypothetical protein
MFFSVPKDMLVSHPNFYYFFGYFDMKAMAFANPVLVVPLAQAWMTLHRTTGSPIVSRLMTSARASSTSSGMSKPATALLTCPPHWRSSMGSCWWAGYRLDLARARREAGPAGLPSERLRADPRTCG